MKKLWKIAMEMPAPVFYTILGANMVLYPLPGLLLAAGLGYARWRHKRVHPVAAAMSLKPVESVEQAPPPDRPIRFADPSPLLPH